ncbi:MAG: hypothetical protein JNM80_08685 [Phycisphaerae bacterium]|nr:hypothetical protein [Phycisphaerae bacterium]
MPPLQAGVPRGVFVEFTSQPNAVLVYTPIPPASPSYANSVATLNGGAAKGSGGFAGITTQGAMVNATVYFSNCPANCDASTIPPFLNAMDFVCFNNRFAAAHILANCDRSTTPPVLNVIDFVCFVNAFAAGCSAP